MSDTSDVMRWCRTCGEGRRVPDILCNLCGLSCVLGEGDHAQFGGLIEAAVVGGYESTPGNGYGALDDTVAYKFSICEFCIDWLFGQFTIPVSVSDDFAPSADVEPWKPASERVAADDWRGMKQKFTEEAARRTAARSARREENTPPIELIWTPEKVVAALEKEKAKCAKGKHWLGLNADLTPATKCAWDFCDYGKEAERG